VAGPAPISLAEATTATSGTTLSSSFTPSPDAAIIIAVVWWASSSNPTLSITDNFVMGGLTWTPTSITTSSGHLTAAVFTALAPSSPTAGTVTITSTQAAVGAEVRPWQVTGNPTTFLGATGTASSFGTGTSVALTLSAAPASSSIVFAFAGSKGPSNLAITDPSGYPNLGQDKITGTTYTYADYSSDQGTTFTGLTWTLTNPGSATATGVIAVEIKQ
jgi:hypothetical protein